MLYRQNYNNNRLAYRFGETQTFCWPKLSDMTNPDRIKYLGTLRMVDPKSGPDRHQLVMTQGQNRLKYSEFRTYLLYRLIRLYTHYGSATEAFCISEYGIHTSAKGSGYLLCQGLCLPCMPPFRANASLSVHLSWVSGHVAGVRSHLCCLRAP